MTLVELNFITNDNMVLFKLTLEEAQNYLKEDDTNTICLKNFSEEEKYYWIDGGVESLEELEIEEYSTIEFYMEVCCPSDLEDILVLR